LCAVGANELGEAQQRALALLGIGTAPVAALEGGPRGRDRRIHVGALAACNLRDHAPVDRAHVVEGAPAASRDVVPVDEGAALDAERRGARLPGGAIAGE
jgi:hypothetical protein